MPNLSTKSIRRIRNKPRYRQFLNDLIIEQITSKREAKPLCPITPIENTVNSEVKLKQFILDRYQCIQLPAEELSLLLSKSTDKNTQQTLIDKEYNTWTEKLISPVARFSRGQSERPTLNEGKVEDESSNQQDTKRRTFVKTKIRPSKKERRTIERQRQRNVVQNLFKKSPSTVLVQCE